ncbi:MAG: hypothetical protein BJ554DRAFT_2213, partial [Olpidium bornovanus]
TSRVAVAPVALTWAKRWEAKHNRHQDTGGGCVRFHPGGGSRCYHGAGMKYAQLRQSTSRRRNGDEGVAPDAAPGIAETDAETSATIDALKATVARAADRRGSRPFPRSALYDVDVGLDDPAVFSSGTVVAFADFNEDKLYTDARGATWLLTFKQHWWCCVTTFHAVPISSFSAGIRSESACSLGIMVGGPEAYLFAAAYRYDRSRAGVEVAGFTVTNVVPGDFDYDGKLDLLVMGQEDPVGAPEGELKLRPAQPIVMDLNGDMRPDLVGYPVGTTGVMSVWRNRAPAPGETGRVVFEKWVM